MADTNLKDAFDIFIKHREAILQMWQFFSTVTLGVLGFTVGSKHAIREPNNAKIVILGYVIFAIANGTAVITSQLELCRMADGLKPLYSKAISIDNFGVAPLSPWLFLLFYVAVVLAVTYAIHRAHRMRVASAP